MMLHLDLWLICEDMSLLKLVYMQQLTTDITFLGTHFLRAAPRTSLTGLQSTVTAFQCTNYKTEVLDSLLKLIIHYLLIISIY